MAALALLVGLTIPMGVWGQTSVTWPGTTALPGTATPVANDQNVTIMVSSTNTYSNPIRIYANTTVTINANNGAIITSVAYEASSTGNYVTVAQNATVSPEVTPSVNGKIVTWTYDESANVTAFTFTPSAQTRSNGITITYITSGSTPTCATPTFSPVAGTYTQAQSVSISCATEGATIYYTTNGNDPTTNSTVYVDPISVSSNMTIKAMAVKSGFDNSAVATAEYAFITLDHAGTLEDPYTVADAYTAIDANAGTQNVYATGIVSNIETAWSSQYNNITFNFVDEEGDEAFLQAFRCVSGTGVDASTVVVGDVVVVYGDLTKYGSTYEFGQGCQLVSLTHTAEPFITVNPTEVNVGAEGATGTLSVTCENIDDTYEIGVRFYEDPQTPATDPAIYEDWFEIVPAGGSSNNFSYEVFSNEGDARTAYLTICAFATNGEMLTESQLVTFNQAAYVAPTFAELPFSFNGGKAAVEETDGLSQEGLGTDYAESTNPTTKLKFDNTGDWLLLQFNERPGTLTYDIKNNSFSGGTFKLQTSEDGVTYTDLETYTEITGTQNEEFTDLGENIRYIKWIYTNKVSGNVGLGNIALAKYVEPVLVPSITVTPTEVNISAEGTTGTLTVTCENIDDTYEIGVRFYADPQTPATNPAIYEDWFEIVPAGSSSNDFSYEAFPNEGDARTAYLTICAFATNGEMLTESQLVTINQAAYVAPPTSGNWVLTDLADLTSGDVFVIVGVDNDTDASYAMSNDKGTSNAPTAVAVTIVDNTLSCEIADNIQWNLTVSNSGYTFYPAGSATTWLYCTNTNNGVRVGSNTLNTFKVDAESGYLQHQGTSRYVGLYTPNGSSSAQDWRCYTNTTGNIANQSFAFYKKVSDDVTYTKSVAAYEGNGGYVLIASPVCSVAPTADNGFLTSEYDLYAFDQAQEQEWRNYETSSFNLVSGKGYMYASSSATTLTITGQPYNGNGMIPLDYTEGVAFAGWNLVGNPYAVAATPNKPYYRLNAAGSEVSASTESSVVNAMEGVFVVATEAGQTVSFSTTNSGSKGESIALNVMKDRGTVIDRAIVRFGEGEQLPKFQLFENSTKLYIPQGNSDYAIVRSAAEGEMPVNFKAKENGTYTISVNTENVEMDYLHLIDNMTGNDVDLLQTPSYTFEATTRDYASRFRLVFNANEMDGPSTGSGPFAYFNGSEWQISNIGEATLQVVDVMGRIVKNVALEGNATVSINEMPGVYMMRLLNGNDVKVQKVIIK
ncbi:MAG: chitobiase/beta-hexosaminidase C-terminal domain-containing protein [Bacteroidales bacterium]|nr:chitobiase/beta-hexosaminidase C-terminal domain-containing protein [Bacteroidales bacterium]